MSDMQRIPDAHLCITDKSGQKLFRRVAGFGFHEGERRNLERHLSRMLAGDPSYANFKVDAATARVAIVVDGRDISTPEGPSDDELLAALRE